MPSGTATDKVVTGEEPQAAKDAIRSYLSANADVDVVFGGAPSTGGHMSAGGLPSARGMDLVGPLSGLTLEFDWYLDFLTLYGMQSRLSTGVEYLLFEVVPLRAAWLYDQQTEDHVLSAGAGFIVPFFGLDVAYQQSVVHPEHRVFATSIKVFLPL